MLFSRKSDGIRYKQQVEDKKLGFANHASESTHCILDHFWQRRRSIFHRFSGYEMVPPPHLDTTRPLLTLA